jgi:hypothetical protein
MSGREGNVKGIQSSGEQFEISHGEERATIVEVDGEVRCYRFGTGLCSTPTARRLSGHIGAVHPG